MAERSPEFRKHRDVLEDVINRMMDSLTSGQVRNGGDTQTGSRFSRRDILAVRSLMDLAAQQDLPHMPKTGALENTKVSVGVNNAVAQASASKNTSGFATRAEQYQVFHDNPNPEQHQTRLHLNRDHRVIATSTEQAFEFDFQNVWDEDRFSLQMLDEMVAIDPR
jgi:hypothetical protein